MTQRPRKRLPQDLALRWALIGCVFVLVAAADWFAGGVGPRLVLGSATLVLSSEPADASVLLNGERIGKTPLRYRDVRPGSVVVRFEHRFHRAVAERVRLARNEEREVHARFPSATGVLHIASNPRGAEIAIDGQMLDEPAPALLSPYPTGAYAVTAAIAGRQSKTETVEVRPNERTDVSFELERLPAGEVFIDVTPRDAKVEIVGLGEPYRRGIRLPRGIYDFRIQRAGYASREFALTVDFGRNRRTVQLDRLHGQLNIDVQPSDAVVHVVYGQGRDRRTRRYAGGLRLPTGTVLVTARAVGYRNYERRLTLKATTLNHAIRMVAFEVEPGRQFRDPLASGGDGPLLVVVPPGTFAMGSHDGARDERPVHTVTVAEPFAMGVFEVTGAEFDRHKPGEKPLPGEAADRRPTLAALPDALARHPVTDVDWKEAAVYLAWLSRETGYGYRLPSEAEWEYVARAGAHTRYPFGDNADGLCAHANIADEMLSNRYRKYSTATCSDGESRMAPVGRFQANAFGAYDMLGNAKEWVADCWRSNYADADGTTQARATNCSAHAVRGGSWNSAPEEATVSFRSFSSGANRSRGFRVVREL